MLSLVITAALNGMDARIVEVETDTSLGLPYTNIIGLGDATVKEAAARIRSSIISSDFNYPSGRITINLAPAWLRKRGSHFDLAMAIGIMASSGQIVYRDLKDIGLLGELSLTGKLNRCKGVMPMVKILRNAGLKSVIVPMGNLEEANLIEGIEVLGANTLKDVADYINGKDDKLSSFVVSEGKGLGLSIEVNKTCLDYAEIRGQEPAKRAITIAAAGGHGILMTGSPGTGKTMMAERLPFILPELDREEVLELTSIYSVAGLLDDEQTVITKRPFRNPGMSITVPGLLGSGTPPRPGEVTLAHKGVLFLDELGERSREVIDCLRLPMESKKVVINRMGDVYRYPADFMFVAATNPCKCGNYGDSRKECTCSAAELQAYRTRLSGPMLGRIDIYTELTSPEYSELSSITGKSSSEMREEIDRARQYQNKVLNKYGCRLNAEMTEAVINEVCVMSKEAERLLERAYNDMSLDPRSAAKVKKIARTIADIDEENRIELKHIAEALQYRERGR